MVVLAEGEWHFGFLALAFLADGADGSLFEVDFGGDWVLVGDCFGDGVVPEADGPVEVVLGDVGVAEEVAELSDVAAHEAPAGFLEQFRLVLLLHVAINI